MQEGRLFRRAVGLSLALHALLFLWALSVPMGLSGPPRARVIQVTVLQQPKKAAAPRTAKSEPRPAMPPKEAKAKPAAEAKRKVEPAPAKPPKPKPADSKPPVVARRDLPPSQPSLRVPSPKAGPAGEVRVARRELPEPSLGGLRHVPMAPGSGTPAGPGRNPQDETPGGNPGGGRRFSKVRPEPSLPDEQISSNPAMPGGRGSAAPQPLPRGVPSGSRDAGVVADAGLRSRHVGGGSAAIGGGSDARGGPRGPQPPETVYMGGGAGGLNLPKKRPRPGGGGGEFVIATGPTPSSDVPTVSPGRGPGSGGGAGRGIGGGLGVARGAGIGVGPGDVDRGAMQHRVGTGIGARAGRGVGTRSSGSGREAAAGDVPGSGGGPGSGYGSGSGYGIGSGRGGAKARPGAPGIPYGDPGGVVTGGNPKGGGGRGGGPGGPGRAIQVARSGGGGPGTGAGGAGDSGAGPWAGRGNGRGAGGRGIAPGTGLGTGMGPGKRPGSGAGSRGTGDELPGGGGGAGGPGGRRFDLAKYSKAVPGKNDTWEEAEIGRGFYPDGIVGKYYNDPPEQVDHAHPETYLNKPIPDDTVFTQYVGSRKDKRIDFNWNPNGEWGDWNKLLSPFPGIHKIYWSARWEGQIFVPKDDTYTFTFDPLDDGGRLYLRFRQGGPWTRVISAWTINKSRPETRGFDMKRGPYDIKIEYAQRPEFYAAVTLKWKSTSFGWEVIGPYQSGGTRRIHR